MSDRKKVIGTHNGKFHADEVFGCFLLKQLNLYKDADIKRTRDPKELEQCDIVIDVGGVYDHSKKRYDHHQRSFRETMKTITGVNEDVIKLSSAGLVWAHYGRDIISTMVKNELSERKMEDLYHHLYEVFVKEIDAKDNGIEMSDPPFRYRIYSDLSSRISRLNYFNPEEQIDEGFQFMKAYELVGKEFCDVVKNAVTHWLPSKEVISQALDNRLSVDPSGRILKFETSGVHWSAHLRTLEIEKNILDVILFVIFPDRSNGWRVQAVPIDGGFGLRKTLLPECLALRDAELASACGVEDAIFVHATGFIGGAWTYEGALKMAQQSLGNHKSIFPIEPKN